MTTRYRSIILIVALVLIGAWVTAAGRLPPLLLLWRRLPLSKQRRLRPASQLRKRP